jgi:hypothetical protein
VGGIAPFYIVPLEPFGARTQCPDDAAILTLRRNQAKAMTIDDKRRGLAGAAGHCSDLRKPEGLPGGGRCGGGEAAGALAPRQDAGRVPF